MNSMIKQKRTGTMNVFKKTGFAVIVLALLSCEQPFKAGLGPVVDIQRPTITLTAPGAGDFIRHTVTFTGTAGDDYKLDSAWFKITNHPDVNGNTWKEYVRVPVDKGLWSCEVDTELFPDGDFKIKLKAVDSSKKIAETDDIAFTIKNQPPDVDMAIPAIINGILDGELGGPHLNYQLTEHLPPEPEPVGFTRILDTGGLLVGMVTDTEGINLVTNPAEGKFPPQIRFWRVNNDPQDPEDGDDPSSQYNRHFLPGYNPTETELPWENLRVEEAGINNYQFMYNLTVDRSDYGAPLLSSRFYAFQVRVQSTDTDRTVFYYPQGFWPRDYWNDPSGPNYDPLKKYWEIHPPAGDPRRENQYVLIYTRSPEEYPLVDLLKLEDILGPAGWNSAASAYNDLPGIDPANDAHPYVDKLTVSKHGSFTLRVKASHSLGITSADVFWDKEGGESGRFLWDPANVDPPGWASGTWNSGNNVQLHRPNNEWGYRDSFIRKGGLYSIRNFIFTYDHDVPGNNRIASDPAVHAEVRGRSKIQVNDGTEDAPVWRDIEHLEEGTYNLRIFTRSSTGTSIPEPFTCSIKIDEVEPTVDLNRIEGAAGTTGSGSALEYIVNGVISPHLIISDSRPQDSGPRTGQDPYYLQPNGQPGYEQRYILIAAAGKAKMEALAGSSPNMYWPRLPASPGGPLVLADSSIQVYRHGPVFNGQAVFKTSQNYYDGTETDALPDGHYLLYVFARDAAFNVGYNSFALQVLEQSDYPEFDFTVGSINPGVTDPNIAADTETDVTGNGFIVSNGSGGTTIRNKFGPNSSIRLRLKDDDGLDLGNAGPSSFRVRMVGATVDSGGIIQVQDINDPAYAIELGDAQVKSLFEPPAMINGVFPALRQRQGEIGQTLLLNLLKAKPAYDYLFGIPAGAGAAEIADAKAKYNVLPDGLYQISIDVKDLSAAKLIELNTTTPAAAIAAVHSFWFAVDSNIPDIDAALVSPPAGSYVSANDTIHIRGTVSDQNGPIKIRSFSVSPLRTTGSADVFISSPVLSRIPNPNTMEYSFDAEVRMNGNSGVFTFTYQFQDRFGNFRTLERRYSVDDVPPTVGLTSMIPTFERDQSDVILVGTNLSGDTVNKSRLANKVIRFTIGANDNFSVSGIRWWLLPANFNSLGPDTSQPIGPGNYGSLAATTGTTQGEVLDYNAFPALDPAQGAALSNGWYGEVDIPNRKYTIYIDTEAMADGEYRLHVMAIDSAGNVSRQSEDAGRNPTSTALQNIFILQEEDKPYFGGISPNSNSLAPQVVGDSGLIVRGTLFEDDGFGDDTTPVYTGSVAISFDNNNDGTYETGPVTITNGLTRQGRNLSLAVNLLDYFTSAEIGTDGPKNYKIEAQDAPVNKWQTNGTPDTASRVTRTKEFSFIYDSVPPEITVSFPDMGASFGYNAYVNFKLQGTMKDINLKKNEDGDYYFKYSLDGGPERIHVLTSTQAPVFNSVTGELSFEIPAATFTGTSILNFGSLGTGLAEGQHTITLIAEDYSGKATPFMLSFVKDMSPPRFSFTNIDITRALEGVPGITSSFNWWTVVDPDFYIRRLWLKSIEDANGNDLSVIYYDTGVPILTGTFEDAVSDIDTATFFYTLDNGAEFNNAEIDGSGKNVRWTVYLTSDGTSGGTPLADGIHSIKFRIKDTSGVELDDGKMYGFRIDSAPPRVTFDSQSYSVFGNASGFSAGATVFTLTGTATDPNLRDIRLIIRDADGGTTRLNTLLVRPANDALIPNITVDTWTYAVDDVDHPAQNIGKGPGKIADRLDWEYRVKNNDLYNGLPNARSYNVIVASIDRNGAESEELVWTFTKDADKPVITFSSDLHTVPSGTNHTPGSLPVADRNVLSSQTPRIQGSVSDATLIKGLQTRIEKWDYGAASDAAAWVQLEDWTNMPGYTADTQREINWTKELTAGVLDAEGLYRIQVRAKDSAYIQSGSDDYNTTTGKFNPQISGYVYYFIDRAGPANLAPVVNNYYSSRVLGGSLIFSGTGLSDPNRFKSVTASITKRDGSASGIANATWAPATPNRGAETQNWTVNLAVPYLGGAAIPSDLYRITFTATDMAGHISTDSRTFTLDNDLPGATIAEPALPAVPRPAPYEDSSVIVLGGEEAVISGTTVDTSATRSESGVALMWYHLGYLKNIDRFPTEADIRADIGMVNSANLNTLAEAATGKPWFKLGHSEVPPNFIIDANPNIYDWRMVIPDYAPGGSTHRPGEKVGGLKQYAEPIPVKGTTYNNTLNLANSDRMVKAVPDAAAGQAGIFSLPLWVAVADNAGNISFFSRDIWIYPNGDIPSTTVMNPETAAKENPRGGSVSADGVAKDNTAVWSVIYRVRADNTQTTTPAPSPGLTVTLNGPTEVMPVDPEYAKIPAAYQSAKWYRANMEAAPGEPTVPWNFTINGNDEIKNLIPSNGFKSNAALPANDMIRVWVEVFVFDGSTGPSLISIGPDNNPSVPVPEHRVFFLKDSSPTISNQKVDGITYLNAGSVSARRGSFTVSALLDAASGSQVKQISVRRPDETGNSGYVTVWENGTATGAIPGISITADTSTTPVGGLYQKYNISYALNSATINGGVYNNFGGRYRIELRLRDSGNPPGEASYTFDVGIDNFAPIADSTHVTNSKVAGQAVDFMGRAVDYRGSAATPEPSERRIEKVYAWFTKSTGTGGAYVNINTGARGSPTTMNISAMVGRTATISKSGDTINSVTINAIGTMQNIPNQIPRNASNNPDVAGGWVKQLSEADAVPGTGISWVPTNVWDIRWSFRADTTKMPDGRITMHYLVYDSAGNVSYYTQDTIIKNKYPQIDRVTMYTDNNGVGAVYTTHNTVDIASTDFVVDHYRGLMNGGYLNSGFISKNQFLGFKVETLYGNPQLHYRLQYVKRSLLTLDAAGISAMRAGQSTVANNVYTIAELGDYSTNNWAALGVNINEPPAGTHFVFTAAPTADLKNSTTAKVWKYTPVLTRPVVDKGVDGSDNNLPVLPNDNNTALPVADRGDGFNFSPANGTFGHASGGDFAVGNPARIDEFDGSHPGNVGGTDNPNDTAFFMIKVWDTVDGTGENDQLYDVLVIGANIYLRDTEKPTMRLYDLNPYTESSVVGNNITAQNRQDTIGNAIDPRGIGLNVLRGGLYNTNTETSLRKSGHIEPRTNTTALYPVTGLDEYGGIIQSLPDGFVPGDSAANKMKDTTAITRDMVSGKLILRGLAHDDQLIREIRIRMGGEADGPGLAILKLDLTGGSVAANPKYRTLQPANGAQASVRELLDWREGHTVEWSYVWDTETRPNASGTPAGNVQIWATVIDELGNNKTGLVNDVKTFTDEANAGAGGGKTVFHNTLNVDIVPYISGFERELPKYATKRSRQGWYSFFQGEGNITALGFNLKGSSDTTMALYHAAAASTTLTVSGTPTVNRVSFAVDAAAQSGKIVLNTSVTVNGSAEALNHRNWDAQSWNKEYHPATPGSDLWTDNPYAHIWRTTHSSAVPVTYFGNNTPASGSHNAEHPGMQLQYKTTATLHGAWGVYGLANCFYSPAGTARVSLRNEALPGEPYVKPDLGFYNTSGTAILLLQNDGNPTLHYKSALAATPQSVVINNSGLGTTTPSPTRRYQNARMSKHTGDGFASVFDAAEGRLWYSKGTAAGYWIDGGNSDAAVTGISASSKAGEYSAIDFDTAGNPVIAYYDAQNDTVRIAQSNSATPAAGNWKRRYVMAGTDKFYRNSGTYISMKIDSSNKVHLAFFNSSRGTVVYASGTLPAYSDAGTNLGWTAYAVDNVVKGGAWTDIAVDSGGNPWISYSDSSRTGNYDGVRIAYKSGNPDVTGKIAFNAPLTDPVSGQVITGWEALSMPAQYLINDDRTNIEAWPPTNRVDSTLATPPGWNAAVGYGSDMFRIGYFYLPGYKDY
jgi:hypothetical protein